MAAPDPLDPPDGPDRPGRPDGGPGRNGYHPHHHDETPPDALGAARGHLAAAVALGTPTLRAGDPRGAYEIYACAARLVLACVSDAPQARSEIAAALDQSDLEPDPRVRAGILHTLFRELVGGYPDPAGVDDPPDFDPADAADPVELVHGYLALATSLGEPALARGHARGCTELYAATARMVLATVAGAAPSLARLRAALDEASKLTDEARQAAALKRGFDAVRASPRPAPGCPGVTRREMRLLLSMAMQIGAPAYNLGDHRGCYETYACCARLLAKVAPPPAAAALTCALQQAAVELDASEQAWILRRTFDALIAAPAAE